MTSSAISDLSILLSSLQPKLNVGIYVYAVIQKEKESDLIQTLTPLATFREVEGLTVVLEESQAQNAGLETIFRCRWITLHVHSDLQAVGLTAAFSSALGKAGISCNVIAGAFHDHIFVPVEKTEDAIQVLNDLQKCSTCT